MTRYVLRPCWTAGLTCLAVFLISPWLSPSVWIVLAAVAAVTLLIAVILPPLRRVHAVPLVAAVVLLSLGIFYGTWFKRVRSAEAVLGHPITLSVTVADSTDRVVLTVTDGALAEGTQIVWYPSDPELALTPHDRFTADFVLQEHYSGSTFSLLMRRASGPWLRVQTVDIEAVWQTLTVGENRESFPQTVRRLLTAVPASTLGGDVGAVVSGICFGADESLSTDAADAFRTCGVSHLFAVSGLHMTVLLQALQLLLRRLRVPRTVRLILSGAFLLLFMMTVGLSASVVRAGTLCLVVLAGDAIKRQADTCNSLGLALLILLLPDPFAAYDVGLLLSFSATYGLLCLSKPIQQCLMKGSLPKYLEQVRRPLVSAIAVSLAATVTTTPVLALYFGRIPLLSVLTNVLITLPAELILIAGFVSSICAVMGLSVISAPFLLIAGIMSRYVVWICQKISTFSVATVAIEATYLLLWIGGTYAVWIFARRLLHAHGKAVLAGVSVAILCIGLLLHRGSQYDQLRVACASDDDLAVTVSYRGSTVLVIAPSSANSVYQAAELLQSQDITRIDLLCLIGGEEPALTYLPSILKNYLGDHTQVVYHGLPWQSPLAGQPLEGVRLSLGEALSLEQRDGHTELHFGEYALWFYTHGVAVTDTAADAVFGAGDHPMYIMTADGPLSLSADIGTVVCRDGQWFC